jgi:hypothetical protein
MKTSLAEANVVRRDVAEGHLARAAALDQDAVGAGDAGADVALRLVRELQASEHLTGAGDLRLEVVDVRHAISPSFAGR